jgi:hypothetical protein
MTTVCSNFSDGSPKFDACFGLTGVVCGLRLEEEEQQDIDDIEALKERQKQREADKKKPTQREPDQNSERRKTAWAHLASGSYNPEI